MEGGGGGGGDGEREREREGGGGREGEVGEIGSMFHFLGCLSSNFLQLRIHSAAVY